MFFEIPAHNGGMNNFEALHPRNGGTGKNRTQFATKQYSDSGIPTLGGGPDLRVVMRGEEAVVMSVAREDGISLLGDTPRDRPLNPITPEMRAQQEAFNQQLQEAQDEFEANRDRKRAEALQAFIGGVPEPTDQEAFERRLQAATAEFNAGPGAPLVTGERPWSPPPTRQEDSISLSDELSKPRRDFNSTREPAFRMRDVPETRVVMRGEQAVVMDAPREDSISLSDELSKPRRGRFSGFFGR